MMRRSFRSALIVCVFAASLQGQKREALLEAVRATSGWNPTDNPTVYDQSNIERFASDLAPTLKRYGLKGVTVQTYGSPRGRARITLFEMLDAGAAYGFFSIRRGTEKTVTSPISIGAESFQSGNRLYFWQSNYVVRIDGASETAQKIAGVLSENILGRSRKPPVSNHLPPRNLLPGSDKYVLNAENIDRAFDLNPAVLGFEDDVEIATASYRVDGSVARLMLLLYPTQQIAKKYSDQMDSTKPGLAAFSKRVGPLVAIVSGTSDAATARSILNDVYYETKVTWSQPRPNLGIAEIILTVFTFIGIGLLFTVIAGIGFGGVRIFVKSRYPNRFFDRPEEMEIIQLKLAHGLIRKELGQ
jgi:hypothetical protein